MRRNWIAVLLVAGAPAAAQQLGAPLAPGETLIQVSGVGEITAVPDQAVIETGVTSDGATIERALAANAQVVDRLVGALTAAGVPSRSIRTSELRASPRFTKDRDGDDTDKITGYRAVDRLAVKLPAALAARVVDALAAAGATQIDGPNFGFADDGPLLARGRAAAVARAEAQARDYAAALHLTGLRPLRVSERSNSAEGGGDIIVSGNRVRATTLQPGEQKVSATVWLDYAAKP